MFNPRSLEESIQMTVGDCNHIPADQRWKVETTIFGEIIKQYLEKNQFETAIDFGCGSGRLSKYLLENHVNRNLTIQAYDQSPSMLEIAKSYVLSDRFLPGPLPLLRNITAPVAPFGFCSYVLQHVPAIQFREILTLMTALAPRWLIINSVCRMAVQNDDFIDDGVNVLTELSRVFTNFTWALPAETVLQEPVMRAMFLEGKTLHYAFFCEVQHA